MFYQQIMFLSIIVLFLMFSGLSVGNGFITFCKHPPGKYCPWNSKRQLDCPQGKYCPKDAIGARTCPVGTYLDMIGRSSITDCKNCSAGKYCSRRGLDLPDGTCKRGYYCPSGATSPMQIICPTDYYCPSQSASPVLCEKGKFQLDIGSWLCSTCPIATILNVTSVPETVYAGDNISLVCIYNVSSFDQNSIPYNVAMNIRHLTFDFDLLNNASMVRELGNSSTMVTNFNTDSNATGKYLYTCVINSTCGVIEEIGHFLITKSKVDQIYKVTSVIWYVIGTVIFVMVIFITILIIFHRRNDNGSSKEPRIDIDSKKEFISLSLPIETPNEKTNTLTFNSKCDDQYSSADLVSKVTIAESELNDCDKFDVFICYSSVDRPWVKNTLLCNLEKRGIRACIDFRDFLVGAYIVENITDAIFNSHKTIAVLSPDFLSSVYCKAELKQALSRLDEHQVIPILYRSCDVPDMLQHKTYLDWCHPDVQPHFWELLFKSIQSDNRE